MLLMLTLNWDLVVRNMHCILLHLVMRLIIQWVVETGSWADQVSEWGKSYPKVPISEMTSPRGLYSVVLFGTASLSKQGFVLSYCSSPVQMLSSARKLWPVPQGRSTIWVWLVCFRKTVFPAPTLPCLWEQLDARYQWQQPLCRPQNNQGRLALVAEIKVYSHCSVGNCIFIYSQYL